MSHGSKLKAAWFSPVFSQLLEHRLEGMVLAGVGTLQVGLHLLGLPGWVCPFKAVFGIPCPGCGLTLAMDELLHGHVGAAVHTHAFAPFFLAASLVVFISIILPEKQRLQLVAAVSQLEIRTGLSAWVLTGLMLYWIIRLAGLV
jgi:hypothetical protein